DDEDHRQPGREQVDELLREFRHRREIQMHQRERFRRMIEEDAAQIRNERLEALNDGNERNRDVRRREEFQMLQREFPLFRPEGDEEEENAAEMQFRDQDRRQEAFHDDLLDEALHAQLRRARDRPARFHRRWEEMRREIPIRLRMMQMRQRDVVERENEMGREEARRVTGVMIRKAQNLREEDESNPSSTRYSRHCVVCASENPRQRAVYTHCGHIVCYSCAVENARIEATGGKCVFSRSTSGFVKLFEEECEEEKKNDVIDENQSMINPDLAETTDSSPHNPYIFLFNGFAFFIVATHITMFLRKRT
ncbi:hypothetical protein PENTCL1PPCAC_8246, partial [Pristionchus entomophagus]